MRFLQLRSVYARIAMLFVLVSFPAASAFAGVNPVVQPAAHMVMLPPHLMVAQTPGMTIGGKTSAWGTTISLSPSNTTTTQKYKFMNGACLFDFSFNVTNTGPGIYAKSTGMYASYSLFSDEVTNSPAGGLPVLKPADTTTVSNWISITPGLHRLRARVAAQGSALPFQSDTKDIAVRVTGPCVQRGLTLPPPIKSLHPVITPTP